MDGTLPTSNLNSTRLFYPFFCAVYHMQYGLPSLEIERASIKPKDYTKMRVELEQVDEIIELLKEEGKTGGSKRLSSDQRKFYNAYNEYWVHADKRRILVSFLSKLLLQAHGK